MSARRSARNSREEVVAPRTRGTRTSPLATTTTATRATASTLSPRSPAANRLRYITDVNRLDSTEFDGELEAPDAFLKTRPGLMTIANEQEAAKLQSAIEGSSIKEHFTKYITEEVQKKILIRQKAMRKLLSEHTEFWTGVSLRPLQAMEIRDFVKLMRICFGNEAADLAGAQSQIVRAFHGKPLTYTNYLELEDACLKAAQVSETYALQPQAQKNIVTLCIKKLRSAHPPSDIHHEESKALLDRVVARGATATIDEFTEEILAELCENKTAVAAVLERGLSRFGMTIGNITTTNKRVSSDDSPDEGAPKRSKSTCFACGRNGHKKSVCSFVEQNHPDVNREDRPWSESTNGKAWAKKNKDRLPGNQTLSGAPFDYVVKN